MYKRQVEQRAAIEFETRQAPGVTGVSMANVKVRLPETYTCLLYTSDAADERSSVDLGGRRIIKKKTETN